MTVTLRHGRRARATTKNVRVRMPRRAGHHAHEPVRAPRTTSAVGEATEVALDDRDHLRVGAELALRPAQRGVAVRSGRSSSRAARGAADASDRQPEEHHRRGRAVARGACRVVLPLMAQQRPRRLAQQRRPDGFARPGRTTNTSAIGTRNSVRRTGSRCAAAAGSRPPPSSLPRPSRRGRTIFARRGPLPPPGAHRHPRYPAQRA